MAKVVYQLEPLTCPSCIKKIETTLNKTAGVETAIVLFNPSRVKTEFNEAAVTAGQLEEIIQRLGYLVLASRVS